ncbi:MAG: iron complex outermembrane receptor protein, partial [Paraglaciecola sp.]
MRHTNLRLNSINIAISSVLGLMGSNAVFAQEGQDAAEKQIEKIRVIGSHLKGTAMETSAPVQTISRVDLEKIGS